MKKIIALLALTITANAAHSAELGYSDLVRHNKVCNGIGEVGIMYYELKKQGQPYVETEPKNTGERVATKAAKYGYYEADNAEDAFMYGWAECMDALEARK
jgi:hypothetical protein